MGLELCALINSGLVGLELCALINSGLVGLELCTLLLNWRSDTAGLAVRAPDIPFVQGFGGLHERVPTESVLHATLRCNVSCVGQSVRIYLNYVNLHRRICINYVNLCQRIYIFAQKNLYKL